MHERFSRYPKQLLVLLTVTFAVFFTAVILFVAIADEVRDGDTLPYDEAVLLAINSRATPLLDAFFRSVTDFGSIGVAVIAVAAAALFMKTRHTYRALFMAVTVGGATLLNIVLKLIFERPRPELWQQLIVEHSFSFPSGHAMASSALAFSLIVLFWRTKQRYVVVALALVYVLVIGVSRLYLGVHYPTDVLAGWLISGAWVALVAAIMWRRHELRAALHNTTK